MLKTTDKVTIFYVKTNYFFDEFSSRFTINILSLQIRY